MTDTDALIEWAERRAAELKKRNPDERGKAENALILLVKERREAADALAALTRERDELGRVVVEHRRQLAERDDVERRDNHLRQLADEECIRADEMFARAEAAEAALALTRKDLARAAYVAENLMGMIDRETWRAEGGDDGQGHYEGDYRAARIMDEIREWKARAALGEAT